jgi:type IV pilus assembly protein PilM
MSILDILKRKESDSILGLDISSSSIKLVQLRKKDGRAVLETYGELALGPYAGIPLGKAVNLQVDKMVEALTNLLTEAKVSATQCGVAVPLNSSLVSLIEMPDLPSKELAKMVPIEVRKYIPFNISEVLLDWWIIPTRGGQEEENTGVAEKIKRVEILVVATHKETIEKYQSIVTASGLTPSFFEIEAFSTVRSVLEGGIAPVAVLDVGASTTKLYIVEGRVLRKSHTINRGAQNITTTIASAKDITPEAAEELKKKSGLDQETSTKISSLVLDYIFSEVKHSLLDYEKKHNRTISRIVLTGGGSIMPGFVETAQNGLQNEVELSDPFSKTNYPAFMEDVLKKAGPEFAVAVGVALRKLEESD